MVHAHPFKAQSCSGNSNKTTTRKHLEGKNGAELRRKSASPFSLLFLISFTFAGAPFFPKHHHQPCSQITHSRLVKKKKKKKDIKLLNPNVSFSMKKKKKVHSILAHLGLSTTPEWKDGQKQMAESVEFNQRQQQQPVDPQYFYWLLPASKKGREGKEKMNPQQPEKLS